MRDSRPEDMMPDVMALVRGPETASAVAPRPAEWTRDAFGLAVKPHVPSLFRLCIALSDSQTEAEDLLQNALVKAYQHRASFRGDGSLLGWLYGIARNEHAEHVRSRARRRGLFRAALDRFGDVFEDWTSPQPTTPESWLLTGENTSELLRALREIPEPYRGVVLLCDIEEMSYEEVAEALNVPIGTVKSRHARGRVRLRKLLDSRGAP